MITFESCTAFGNVLVALFVLSFIAFVVCAVVFDYNERDGWQSKSTAKKAFYFLPLFYPKESINSEYVSWYPIYKLSFIVTISSALLLLIGSSFGEFCVYSQP